MTSSGGARLALLVLVLVPVLATLAGALNPHLQPPTHDPVAATRGLIQRRLGAAYNDQVRLFFLFSIRSSLVRR